MLSRRRLIDHKSIRFHRRRRIVESVRVLSRLILKLALIAQRARTTVAKESENRQKRMVRIRQTMMTKTNSPIMSYELDLVSIVAGLDAIDADCISIRCVACAASAMIE